MTGAYSMKVSEVGDVILRDYQTLAPTWFPKG